MFVERFGQLLRQGRGIFSNTLEAEFHDTGWLEGDCAYHGVRITCTGEVYFSVGSHIARQSAHVFAFHPQSKKVEKVWNAGQSLEANTCVAQGKIHAAPLDLNGELIVITHSSWYYRDHTDPATGLTQKPYPGGYIFSIHPESGRSRIVAGPLGIGPVTSIAGTEKVPMMGEGLIAGTLDPTRKMFFAITWPSGHLVSVDLESSEICWHGALQEKAETVAYTERGYQRVLRTIGLDDHGNLYGCNGHGRIWKLQSADRRISFLNARMENATRAPLPAKAPWLNMWRTIVWDANEKVFYGVHWSTSWLFRFDPAADRIEPLAPWRAKHMITSRINSDYAQLGLAIGPNRVLYGLVHSPSVKPGTMRAVHLLTYDIKSRLAKDHGRVIGEHGKSLMFAESCAVAANGDVYSVGWVEVDRELQGQLATLRKPRSDAYTMALVSIPANRISLGI